MSSSMIPTNTGAPTSTFWGGFGEAVAGTLARTIDQVAPVWANKALGLQQTDQLARDGTVYVAMQPRVDELRTTQSLLGNGGGMTPLLVIGGAVLLGVVLLR